MINDPEIGDFVWVMGNKHDAVKAEIIRQSEFVDQPSRFTVIGECGELWLETKDIFPTRLEALEDYVNEIAALNDRRLYEIHNLNSSLLRVTSAHRSTKEAIDEVSLRIATLRKTEEKR